MKTLWIAAALFLMGLLQLGALSDDQKTNLFAAVRSGNVTEVERCLAAGANINSREVVPTKPRLDDHSGKKETLGDTPLMIAAQSGHLDIVKLLLARGADVNASGEAGYTPLMGALVCRQPEIALFLLEKGANPNRINGNGDTAIIFASNAGYPDVVAGLLDHGADINGGTGWTPLMRAAYDGDENVVMLLLKRGANVNLRRENGMTPLECALIQHNDEIATLLRKAGGKGRSAAVLDKEIEQANVQMLKAARIEAARRQANSQRFRNERLLTPEDQDVVETALLDMLAYQGKDGFRVNPAQHDIALVNVTAVNMGLLGDEQLNCELDVERANEVTLDMREHLQQRNWMPTSLKDFKPRNTHIILVEEKDVGGSFSSLGNKYPHIRGWAQICLPGYSKQHNAVVVRFITGPSAHGAAGTYFLVKQDGKWHVKWRQFAHYA